MKYPRTGYLFLTIYLLGLAACGAGSQAPSTPDTATIEWRVGVESQAGSAFGARFFVDGQEIAADPAAMSATAVLAYVSGPHVVEVEIASGPSSSAVYRAWCTASLAPSGRLSHVDGVPVARSVGERIRLQISL